jgi:hypothetical protein
METVPADALVQIAESDGRVRSSLACTSKAMNQSIREIDSGNRYATTRTNVWLRRNVRVRLVISSPHTLRLVWRAGSYVREVWIHLQTATNYSRFAGGQNVVLRGMDCTFKYYGTHLPDISWADSVEMYVSTSQIEIVIHNRDGLRPRLMNRRKTVIMLFAGTPRAYSMLLRATPPTFAAWALAN